jgi:hypothetical protein
LKAESTLQGKTNYLPGEKYYDDFLKKSFQIIYSGLLITTFIEKLRRIGFWQLQRKDQCQE